MFVFVGLIDVAWLFGGGGVADKSANNCLHFADWPNMPGHPTLVKQEYNLLAKFSKK